ncbi:MAG: transaldolase family protein [Caulobacteraceae bacterium]|jgi:transaldolase|nr:transaldolase family protein [Caulobacteraceae bacterium]
MENLLKLFMDTAEIDLLSQAYASGLVDGVTTNPSLIAKSGRPILQVISEICGLVDGPVSAEVAALDAAGMITEGRRLAAVASNVVVKVPLTREGLKATSTLAAEGKAVNVTLCFSVAQALLAAKAGAAFISPFVGRLEDAGEDGIGLIQNIRRVYDAYGYPTKILAASVRTRSHVEAVAIAGADCATLPVAVFDSLFAHPLTDKGLETFLRDWAETGQSIT